MEFLLGAFQGPFFLLFSGAVAVVWQKKLSLINLSCNASNCTAELIKKPLAKPLCS